MRGFICVVLFVAIYFVSSARGVFAECTIGGGCYCNGCGQNGENYYYGAPGGEASFYQSPDGTWHYTCDGGTCAADTGAGPPPCHPSCPSSYCGSPGDGCGGSCDCRECEMCVTHCGQPRNCSGPCATDDEGIPASNAAVSPLGTLGGSETLVFVNQVALAWTASVGTKNAAGVELVDSYDVEVYDDATGTLVWSTNIANPNLTVTTAVLPWSAVYRWHVRPVNSTCTVQDGDWTPFEYFRLDQAPLVINPVVKTSDDKVDPADKNSRNNICEPTFLTSSNPRQIKFDVTLRDGDGWNEITSATVSWKGHIYDLTLSSPGSGTDILATTTIDFPNSDNDPGLYPFHVNVIDKWGARGTNGPVARWNFDETSGTVAADSSGFCGPTCKGVLTSFADTSGQDVGNTVTDSGWTAARKRWGTGALMFDGTSNYVSVVNNEVLNLNQISVEAWIKPTSIDGNTIILGKTNGSWVGGFGLTFYNDSKLHFWINAFNNASVTTATIETGKWSQVVGTYDQQTVKLYVNGVLVDSVAYNQPIVSSGFPLEIGRVNVAPYYFKGVLDSVAIYNQPITAAEVANDYLLGASFSTDRNFKVWDCKVPVNGIVYDGAAGQNCTTGVGFSTPAPARFNFLAIGYTEASPARSSVPMNVSPPSIYTNNGIDQLLWGRDYWPELNNDIQGTSQIIRMTDKGNTGNNKETCYLTNQFSMYHDPAGEYTVDPYAWTPQAFIDYSFITDQDPWFQVVGAGVLSQNRLETNVPVTCPLNPPCKGSTSINGVQADGGLLSGAVITTNSGCDLNGMCKYGETNNWYKQAPLLSGNDRLNYNNLMNRYFAINGVGVTINGDSSMSAIMAGNIGGTGVVFVKGNFNVDIANVLPVGKFLMIIASGTIHFDSSVPNSAGIFMADRGIVADGVSVVPLMIDGVLFSDGSAPVGNIHLSRGFVLKRDNNVAPSVVVNYRPDFVFNMPGKIARVLTGWSTAL